MIQPILVIGILIYIVGPRLIDGRWFLTVFSRFERVLSVVVCCGTCVAYVWWGVGGCGGWLMRVWRLTCMCGFRLAGGNHGPMDAFLPHALSVLRAPIPLSFVLVLRLCCATPVATAREAVEKVARAPVSRFQAGGSAADDVHVQLHLHVADVDAPRANAVVFLSRSWCCFRC